MTGRTAAYGRAAFAWAVRRGAVHVNPFADLPVAKSIAKRERVLSDDEIGEIWRAAGEAASPYGAIIRLLILTGQRRVGRHRLLCGDATERADVDFLLAGAQPHLMVTDPPYGVNYDADWRNSAQRANGQPYGGRAVGKVTNDDCVDWRAAWKLFKGDVA